MADEVISGEDTGVITEVKGLNMEDTSIKIDIKYLVDAQKNLESLKRNLESLTHDIDSLLDLTKLLMTDDSSIVFNKIRDSWSDITHSIRSGVFRKSLELATLKRKPSSDTLYVVGEDFLFWNYTNDPAWTQELSDAIQKITGIEIPIIFVCKKDLDSDSIYIDI